MNEVQERQPRRRPRVLSNIPTQSKTEQAHKADVNINTIMAKARRGQMVPQTQGGLYGDFTGMPDFHEAQNRIQDAYNDFMRLPATMRKKFNNDPGYLLDFLNNPENESEAQQMGLIPMPVPEPAPVVKPAETATEAVKTPV